MYRIGDFSKITQLTVKTLRYYDQEGILSPSHRDQENQYRYYSEADFQRAQLIRTLRELDFSIAEIKDVLNNYEAPEDLSYFLREKQQQIYGRILKEKALIEKIETLIQSVEDKVESIHYPIEDREIPPVTVASFRFTGRYDEVGKHIGKIYRAIKGKPVGTPFCLHHNDEYQEVADIEICVPAKEIKGGAGVSLRQLPGVKALVICHKGSYQTINLAYKAILDEIRARKLTPLGPTREVYIKGPGLIFRGNENNYLTEIILPYGVHQ